MNLIGNIDPVHVFLSGNENLVVTKTNDLMRVMENKSNFILSSGCDLPKNTPVNNINAFMNIARSPIFE